MSPPPRTPNFRPPPATPGSPSSRRRRCDCALAPSATDDRGGVRVPVKSVSMSAAARPIRPCAFEVPLCRARAQFVRAGRMLTEKRRVGAAGREELVDERQRNWQISPGLHGQMQVGLLRKRRSSRVDYDQLRAVRLRAFEMRHEVNAGRRWICAPDDDELGRLVVFVGDAGHFAVERARRFARRRRANRPREARGAEPAKQPRIFELVGEQAVRPASRRAAPLGAVFSADRESSTRSSRGLSVTRHRCAALHGRANGRVSSRYSSRCGDQNRHEPCADVASVDAPRGCRDLYDAPLLR